MDRRRGFYFGRSEGDAYYISHKVASVEAGVVTSALRYGETGEGNMAPAACFANKRVKEIRREDKNRLPPATEMELFLPGDGSDVNNSSKYKVSLKPRDQEDNLTGPGSYDPFKNRALGHATTDCDTVTHLLKASLGTGILAMPIAFKFSGLSVGIAATLLVAVVCTHCSYILVKCAHHLYYTTRVSAMSFADVGEVAFANGPTFAHKFSKFIRLTILVSLFATYFGTCSVYTVIIGNNFQQVNFRLIGESCSEVQLISTLYALTEMFGTGEPIKSQNQPSQFSAHAHLTTHALYSQKQVDSFVVLWEEVKASTTLEHPSQTGASMTEQSQRLRESFGEGPQKGGMPQRRGAPKGVAPEMKAAQIVKVLIGLAVFCTYGLQFFVCLEIAWNAIKERFSNKLVIREYLLRTLLVTLTVALAVSVPTISPFIGLIGSLCFSTLGLIIPAFIEVITFWEEGFGTGYYRIWKNVLVIMFGVMALLFGSYTSILDIVALYKP
uniref:Amino acid transporter transmembrane domain-containing protein n=2 Tax=Timema TaxID=61471 RepID=A0A7R9HNL0_9NEOP|nr:unnamed protein product [Timema monikensis]